MSAYNEKVMEDFVKQNCILNDYWDGTKVGLKVLYDEFKKDSFYFYNNYKEFSRTLIKPKEKS